MKKATPIADAIIRVLTALTVVALGAVAAVVSYSHALEVALGHGQAGLTAHLTPLTIDGLVLVAGLVLLDAARRRIRGQALAYVALALGIGATLAVNVLYGLDHGPVGAAVAGWPAVALVLTHELLMRMIRRGRPVVEAGDGMDAHVSDALALVAARPVAVAAVRPVLADLPPVELPALPVRSDVVQTVDERPAPVGSVSVSWLAPPALEGVEEAPVGRAVGQEGEVSGAGQEPVADLASAIASARAAGRSIRAIASEFGVTKYRVSKALEAAGV